MVVEGGIVSHYCISFILVNCNFTDLCHFSDVLYVVLFLFSLCRVWNMQHIAYEQGLCLGKGQKSWEEKEEGKGGEP